MDDQVVLEAKNISKHFGMTHALKNVDLILKKGSIHSLVGRNGAGKSTLVNIIAGVYKQDAGQVVFQGQEITHLSLKERQECGICLVPQHASVVPNMTVAENISIGLWPKNKLHMVDWKKMNERAIVTMEEFGMSIDPNTLVRDLTPVEQRKVNIVRALFGGGKLVILDEPTTSLSSEDRDNLFRFVKDHAQKGITFVLISHYLEEILNVSDDITVVRDGQSFHEAMKDKNSQDELASMIAGEEVELTYRDAQKQVSDEVVLECRGLSAKYLNPTSLQFHKGEIVGMVGFPGSGARELCTAIYGIAERHAGEIFVNGVAAGIKNAGDALKYKICYVPEDRHKYGIVPIMSIKENIGLSSLKGKLKKTLGFIDLKKEQSIAENSARALNIKMQGVQAPANSLSGGNQQKVVLGKVLACDPDVLILDEPTIGIDIKSREEIMKQIQTLTDTLGLCVIYLTNDFDELLRIADRIVVFSDGDVVGDVKNSADVSPETIIEIRDKKAGKAI